MDEAVFLEKVHPMFRSLFGIAHAVTGRYDLAELTLRKAMLAEFDASMTGKPKLPLHERMRQRVLRYSAEQNKLNGLATEDTMTWTGFDDVDTQGNLFLAAAVQEPLMMRRILMMKFGAGLHSYEISPLIGMDKKRVRSYLIQFEARVVHNLQNSQSYEKLAKAGAMRVLNSTSADVPDYNAFTRQIQSEFRDSYATESTRPAGKIVSVILMTVGIVLCIILFWLFAVLIEPTAKAEVGIEVTAYGTVDTVSLLQH